MALPIDHICRRQGGKKNQQRRGCIESVPNMARACRIRISRFRKLLAWLTKAGILIAEYRENRTAKYTVAPGRQMIMPMIIDDLKLTPTQNAVARIMLRYGIISIRQAARLANASARTAARTVKILEQKEVVNVRRIQGCTSEYKFCRKVLKLFGRTVPKKTGLKEFRRKALVNQPEKSLESLPISLGKSPSRESRRRKSPS